MPVSHSQTEVKAQKSPQGEKALEVTREEQHVEPLLLSHIKDEGTAQAGYRCFPSSAT